MLIAKTGLWCPVIDEKSLTASMRLFLLSSVSGVFEATEIQNPARSPDHPSPFPVVQSDLYKQSQPGTWLLSLLNICYCLANYYQLQSEDVHGSPINFTLHIVRSGE